MLKNIILIKSKYKENIIYLGYLFIGIPIEYFLSLKFTLEPQQFFEWYKKCREKTRKRENKNKCYPSI